MDVQSSAPMRTQYSANTMPNKPLYPVLCLPSGHLRYAEVASWIDSDGRKVYDYSSLVLARGDSVWTQLPLLDLDSVS